MATLTPLQWIGALRTASGLLFVVNPSGIAEAWVNRRSGGVDVLTRSVGVRDLVIGAGLTVTGRPEWLVAGICADLTDGVDAVRGHVPAERKKQVMF